LVCGKGIAFGTTLASASLARPKLAEKTLDAINVPRKGRDPQETTGKNYCTKVKGGLVMITFRWIQCLVKVTPFLTLFSLSATAFAAGPPWKNIEKSCSTDKVYNDLVTCLMTKECDEYTASFNQDPKSAEKLINKYFTLTKQCVTKASMEQKIRVIRQLEALRDRLVGEDYTYGLYGFNPAREHMCGGVLEAQYSRIELTPDDIDMEIGDTETISAKVVYRFSTNDEEAFCGCALDDTPCAEEYIKTDIVWEVDDEDIVKINEVDEKNNRITVEAVGTGKTYIYAHVPSIEEFGANLGGSVSVTVGKKLDIAFVIDTNAIPYGYCNFPEGKWCDGEPKITDYAADYYATITENFSDYSAGLYSFSNHESLCLESNELWCMDPSFVPCYSFKVHANYMRSESEFIDAFDSLRGVCNTTSAITTPTGSVPPFYYGGSVHTALLQTVDTFYWRDDAEKVIVLVGFTAAGLYESYGQVVVCSEVEPVSGISFDDVIQKAVEEEIKIIAINSRAWQECYPGIVQGYNDCVTDSFITLSDGTGGQYYPANIHDFDCYPPDYEVIISAIEEIADMTE
jgi:hypothetical protein